MKELVGRGSRSFVLFFFFASFSFLLHIRREQRAAWSCVRPRTYISLFLWSSSIVRQTSPKSLSLKYLSENIIETAMATLSGLLENDALPSCLWIIVLRIHMPAIKLFFVPRYIVASASSAFLGFFFPMM